MFREPRVIALMVGGMASVAGIWLVISCVLYQKTPEIDDYMRFVAFIILKNVLSMCCILQRSVPGELRYESGH